MKRNSRFFGGETVSGWLFNLPTILIAILFILLPVTGTLVTSFFRDVTFMPGKFIWFDNYSRLLTDPHFWSSMGFTLVFTVVSVLLELVLGMIFALLLNETLPFRGFFRVAVLIPWAIPIAISARIWELLYNYNYGLFNYILIQTGITDGPVNWLGTPLLSFVSVVVSDVWKTTPFIAIILLAGLSTIPRVTYGQARIDGANTFQRFTYVTLPLLKPALVVALLFRTIDAVRIFDLIFVLTGGGPGGSTTSLSLYAYNYYVTGDFGYGSSVSVVVFFLAALLGVFYIYFGKFRENLR